MQGVPTGVQRGARLAAAFALTALMSVASPASAHESEGPPTQVNDTRRILVVFACHPLQVVCAESLSAVAGTLAEAEAQPTELFAEYLDEGRLGAPRDRTSVARHLAARYADARPDLLVADGDTVAQLLVAQRDALWPGVPVIAYAQASEGGAPPGVVRLTQPRDIYKPAETVAAALRMVPGATRVAYVGGSGPLDHLAVQVFRQHMRERLPAVPIVEITGLTLEATLARVGALPADTVVYTFGILVDATGRRHLERQTIDRIIAASNRPVFVLRRDTMGSGAVGGILSDTGAGARHAARAALAVLRGDDPRRVPGPEAPQPVFDWRQLRRWGIDEARLPAASLVLYREPSFLQRYQWWIALAAVQLALIAGLLVERRHRQRAARAAATSESLNRSVIASLAGRIAVLDAQGTVLQVNADWAQRDDESVAPITRAQPGDNLRSRLAAIEDDTATTSARAADALAEVLDGRQPEARVEFTDAASPAPRWHRWLVQALDRPEGGALVSLVDITDRKRAELEDRRALQDMAHAARVVSLGQLTSSLAHEINQPLSAILTNAEVGEQLAGRAQPDMAAVCEVFRDIATSSERAGEIIRRMRAMLRKDEARREPVDLQTLVGEVLTLLAPEAQQRRVQVHADIAEGLPPVVGDPVQLQQVVLNLVVNAIDAIGTDQARPHAVLIRARAEGSDVALAVIDDGPGIPGDVLPRLFEPFFTTKAKGLGMGLAIIRSIVEAHGGLITARNNDGPGATFTCRLPAALTPDA